MANILYSERLRLPTKGLLFSWIITLAAIASGLHILYKAEGVNEWVRVLAGGTLIGLPISVYLLSPRQLIITPQSIIIKRLVHRIIIPRQDISGISQTTSTTIKTSYRKLASGGIFGYFGLFSHPTIGNYYLQVPSKHCKGYYIIKCHHGRPPYILSSETPEELERALQQIGLSCED